MGLIIYQVDAFTDRPFAGNPAAVCLLPGPREDAWMQAVAQEMNLAETAFLVRQEGGFGLRWFTPAVEVDLCGHATLASAHALWECGELERNLQARFHTRSGLLACDLRGDWIEMDFPAREERAESAPPGLLEALGCDAVHVGKNIYDYIVEVESPKALRGLNPDHRTLRQLPVRGIIVTSRSDRPEYDFISRFFAPGSGIDEDPVTGSAHCCLAPYWAAKLGKPEMTGYQASPRGGVVKVRIHGDRVILAGQAVTTLRGELAEAAAGEAK